MLTNGLFSFWIWASFAGVIAIMIWSIVHVPVALTKMKQSNLSD